MELSSESSRDYGSAYICPSTSYSNSSSYLVYSKSGEIEANNYEGRLVLNGGNTYYLHLRYQKDGKNDVGDRKK